MDLPVQGRNMHITRLLELVCDHLRDILGVRKSPLSYVVRPEVVPTMIENDPINVSRSFSVNYTCYHDELIARAEHDHPNYGEDSLMGLGILVAYLNETRFMTSLKPSIHTKDGRGARFALETQNLGDSKWDEVIAKAEHTVLNLPWSGKVPRYTLDRHIDSHRAVHNDMLRAG